MFIADDVFGNGRTRGSWRCRSLLSVEHGDPGGPEEWEQEVSMGAEGHGGDDTERFWEFQREVGKSLFLARGAA